MAEGVERSDVEEAQTGLAGGLAAEIREREGQSHGLTCSGINLKSLPSPKTAPLHDHNPSISHFTPTSFPSSSLPLGDVDPTILGPCQAL